jgi:hypothetical protein
MVNLFQMERMGIPYNNADSLKRVNNKEDYEIKILKEKLKEKSNKEPQNDGPAKI